MHEHVERRGSSSGRWPTTWVALCALAAMALLFLWQQHGAHILGVIPYLLLLAARSFISSCTVVTARIDAVDHVAVPVEELCW